MNDSDTNIAQLKRMVKTFCEERDWGQHHNPKDLSVSMAIEVAELLAHFRFQKDEETKKIIKDQVKKEEISEEMSDILYHILRMADLYDIDISSSFKRKMEKTEKNYPIEKSKGQNKKYTEL